MAQLPEELWSLICEQLRPQGYNSQTRDLEFHTLRNVCLTSKACYVAAKPHLYHALDFEGPRINGLRPVLRVLLRDPRLCKLVKSLHVRTWETEYDREQDGTSDMITDIEGDLDVPWEALDLGLSSADAFRLSLAVRARIRDAELAALLYICRGLELIEFHMVDHFQQSLVHTALGYAYKDLNASSDGNHQNTSLRPLQHVRELHIYSHEEALGYPIQEIAIVLQLPRLGTVRGEMINVQEDQTHPQRFTSTLKHAYFCSGFDAEGVAWLLARCQALETLELSWDGPPEHSLHFDDVSAAILNGAPHLTALKLSQENVDPYLCQRGTLTRASRLKSLAISAWALFCHGDEEEFDLEHRLDMVLPLSLEVLEIEWADDDIFLGDDELLVAMLKSGRFANLKQILIEREVDFTGNLEGLQWEHRPSDGHRVEVRRLY